MGSLEKLYKSLWAGPESLTQVALIPLSSGDMYLWNLCVFNSLIWASASDLVRQELIQKDWNENKNPE